MNHSPDIRWQQRFENFDRALSLLKEALSRGGQTWIDMIDHRNLLSHTYDAAKFEEAVDAIHGRYLAAFAQVRDLLGARKNT